MGKISKTKELAISGDIQGAVSQWDFYESGDYIKEAFPKWQRATEDLIVRLWIARKALSNQGKRTDLEKNVTPGEEADQPHSWQEFCEYVGIPRRSAESWIERFIPEEGVVLLPEELRARKKAAAEEKERHHRWLIEQYEETGVKPEGWDKYTDKLHKFWLIEKGRILPPHMRAKHDAFSITARAVKEDTEMLDMQLFSEVWDRNIHLVFKDPQRSKRFLEREQLYMFYRLEEYVSSFPAEFREQSIAMLAKKLEELHKEVKEGLR